MNKTILKILRYILFFALGVLLLYFAFRNVDFKKMLSILGNAKYSWVLLSLFISVLAFLSRAKRWMLLIEPLGYKPGFWNSLIAVWFGYLTNYAFPRMGEISKCVALNRKEKIPVDSLVGTVVLERTIDLISMIVIMIMLLIIRFEKFGNFFNEYIFRNLGEKGSRILGNTLLLYGGIAVLVISVVVILVFLRTDLKNTKLVKKLFQSIKNLFEGFKSVTKMKNKWEFLFHTFFIWTCYAFMTWVVVFALPDITGDLKFGDGIFLLVIGSLGMAAPVQAGIGAFHWIVSKGLVTIYGLSDTEGQSFASLQHFSQTLLVFLLGVVAMIFLYTRIGNANPAAKDTNE